MPDELEGAKSHVPSTPKRGWLAGEFREFAITVIAALAVAFLIRTFLIQPFYIPSSSMYPTLEIDDKIAVSKLEPGVLDVQRGDVVVFEDPGDWLADEESAGFKYEALKGLSYFGLAADPDRQYLVKRVIGISGDRVECRDRGGRVFVNGEVLADDYVNPDSSPCNYVFDIEVPDEKLWVMGDNRTASADSSYHEYYGDPPFVSMDDVQGKAIFTFWPISRWSRL